jgi:hypothetical protein
MKQTWDGHLDIARAASLRRLARLGVPVQLEVGLAAKYGPCCFHVLPCLVTC